MRFGKAKRVIERLLIVEDEPLIAFDTEHLLRDAGYTIVATVDTVSGALRVIADAAIDLVLADVNLSDGGSGMDVAHAAKEKGVPLLFVTGNCPVEAQAFAVGCLAKPYSQRALIAAIETIDATLSGRRAHRPPAGLTLYQR